MPIDRAVVVGRPGKQADGSYRGVIDFILTDGRVIRRDGVRAPSQEALDARPNELTADVLEGVIRRDAEEAVQLGIQIAHKEASQNDVYYAWMQAAFNEDDPVAAYNMMKEVAPVLVGMGLTAEQYAVEFNAEVVQVQRLLDRWAYLDSKKAELESFRLLREGDI